MATQVEQLMSRLRDPKFKRSFCDLCGKVVGMAGGFCNEAQCEDLAYLVGDWWGSVELAMESCGRIDRELEDRTRPLPNPSIITHNELWDEFKVYIEHETYDDFDDIYEHYLDHIEHRLLRLRESEPFELSTLLFAEGSEKLRYMIHGILMTRASILGDLSQGQIEASSEALVAGEEESTPQVIGRIGEFELLIAEVRFSNAQRKLRKPDSDQAMSGTMFVKLAGRASAGAMDALARNLAPVAQSHFRSVALLTAKLDVETFRTYLPFGIAGLAMATLNTSNKDTFERRIANAVRLLAEADRQQSEPIGLSLCVTAIDALLGRQGPEMSKTLADFVAGLLEPDVALRRQAADFVTDLYDKRSRVLHGDRLDGNSKLRSDARLLAASVLHGVWSYQDFFERFYDSTPRPADFFGKLRDDFVRPGLPDGVLSLPVRSLWQPR